MAEYGSGISLAQAFKYDKERVLHALKGELMVEENADGFIYEPASKEECDEYIISAFDNAVYHVFEGHSAAKAIETLFPEIVPSSQKDLLNYMVAKEMALKEIRGDYKFDIEEDKDE